MHATYGRGDIAQVARGFGLNGKGHAVVGGEEFEEPHPGRLAGAAATSAGGGP
jgi:hypothetical protein